MVAFSVAICCANAQDTLEAACQSVAWADELVIVDSGSTDATADISKHYAHQYFQEPWRGYSGQKQFAAGLCRNDWVLVLDSDEECSPLLASQLQSLDTDATQRYDMLLVPRKNYVLGRRARCWDPDFQSRVIQRHRVTWPDEVLHDDRKPSHRSRQGKLTGPILHKRASCKGFDDYFGGRRLDARLLPVARQMHECGRRCHWWDLAFRPSLAFLKHFVVKRGFREGTFGLLIAQKTALTTQLKYAALWAVQNDGASDPSHRPADSMSTHSNSST